MRGNEITQNDEKTLVNSVSYDSNIEANFKSSEEPRTEIKLKKHSLKKQDSDQFMNPEIKNLVTKSEKLNAKFGGIDEASINNFSLNNINLKLHHLETDVRFNPFLIPMIRDLYLNRHIEVLIQF